MEGGTGELQQLTAALHAVTPLSPPFIGSPSRRNLLPASRSRHPLGGTGSPGAASRAPGAPRSLRRRARRRRPPPVHPGSHSRPGQNEVPSHRDDRRPPARQRSTMSALNSGANDRRGPGLFRSMVSMMGVLSGAAPLMLEVRAWTKPICSDLGWIPLARWTPSRHGIPFRGQGPTLRGR
jgi:hypothetical protein